MEHSPAFSIVIPAYNQAEFLADAIRSVLNQTFGKLEIVVVNDASPDSTSHVVDMFSDPRIHLVEHPENRGLPATRNTGIRYSNGDWIAFLDADDYFHPEKLATHAAFLNEHPEVGVTYNGRYELNYSSDTIRNLSRPPLSVGFLDFLAGFPFAPSDMVMRRNWAVAVDLFDEACVNGSEDLEFPARLALAGCRFASVDRILNYRRHHSNRYRKNLRERFEEANATLARLTADPRCPEGSAEARDAGMAHQAMVLAFHAFVQHRTQEGRQFLEDAVRLRAGVVEGNPCELVNMFLSLAIADDSADHVAIMSSMFEQLPESQRSLRKQAERAIAYGFLVKMIRALFWGRLEAGQAYASKARDYRWTQEPPDLLHELADQISIYESEFGAKSADGVLRALDPSLTLVLGRPFVRRLRGLCLINRAFSLHHKGQSREVASAALRGVWYQPGQILNRGLHSLLRRSLLKRIF